MSRDMSRYLYNNDLEFYERAPAEVNILYLFEQNYVIR